MSAASVTTTEARTAPQLAPTYLAISRVGKTFGDFTALADVNLDIQEGEFVSFLGPSGCGKTTLLRAIAGLDPATSGSIRQGGREITGLPPSERDFGIVFQSYALFPNFSVTHNIGYGLRGPAWPRSRVESRVHELLQLVGLVDHAKKYPAQLSGGQQQRVALARAIAPEPGLLLLDEPLSALDAIVRLHLRQELRGLQRRLGVTTILVTHDQEEAMAVSDRIVVMSRGKIEQVGTPEEIYRRPASAFVAGFVGRSAAFDAKVRQTGTIVAGDLELPAEAARAFRGGAPVRVYARPEDVRIGHEATALPGAFEAEVTHLEFLGSLCRVTLEHPHLRIEADISPDAVRPLGVKPGLRIPVALAHDRLLVFAGDE